MFSGSNARVRLLDLAKKHRLAGDCPVNERWQDGTGLRNRLLGLLDGGGVRGLTVERFLQRGLGRLDRLPGARQISDLSLERRLSRLHSIDLCLLPGGGRLFTGPPLGSIHLGASSGERDRAAQCGEIDAAHGFRSSRSRLARTRSLTTALTETRVPSTSAR